MNEEILDLVDNNDSIIGKMPRSEVYARGMNNFRVINCFIKNKKGMLWIPRRTANKKLFPLCLDISCGGHVSSGETYEEAFAKEMDEELRIDINKNNWKLLGALTPEKHKVSAFMKVYEMELDEVPNYNSDDFFEYYWLTPKELLEKIDKGDKAKSDLPKIVKAFYL